MAAVAAPARERPIPFSGAMVRAILEGRKTQTRRLVKLPRWFVPPQDESMVAAAILNEVPCPYGRPGDRLWVREAWACSKAFDRVPFTGVLSDSDTIWYRESTIEGAPGLEGAHGRWRSPRFMPRRISRITLELTGVRVERLHNISEFDAIAEGAPREPWAEDCTPEDSALNATCGYFPPRSHIAGFAGLWDSLNEPRGCGWHVNPWVWVLEFRRTEVQS